MAECSLCEIKEWDWKDQEEAQFGKLNIDTSSGQLNLYKTTIFWQKLNPAETFLGQLRKGQNLGDQAI